MRTRSTVLKLSPAGSHNCYDGWNNFNRVQNAPENANVVWTVTSLRDEQSGKLWFDSWQGKILLSSPPGCCAEEKKLLSLFSRAARSLPRIPNKHRNIIQNNLGKPRHAYISLNSVRIIKV